MEERHLTYSQFEVTAQTSRGHVSNVTLFDYLDQARNDWYRYSILLNVEAVVVHVGLDYKKEVFDQDRISIRTELSRVGNTSLTLKQTAVNHKQELVASAEIILATIDRQSRVKTRVPDEIRNLLNQDKILNHLELTAKIN